MKLEKELERYKRQIAFSEIDKTGQKKLLDSFVVIIGAGALGGVIASNLARAGIGRIKIIDRDYVELENLQRQVLLNEDDAENKVPKAAAVSEKLKKINSQIEITAEVCDVNHRNIERLINGAQVVLDATDNFYTRFLINEACLKNKIPWIYGAVVAGMGLTMNIIPSKTSCFHCILPQLPAPGTGPTCQTVGILNTIVNITASVQSTEAIKLLIGSRKLSQKLLFIDIWNNVFEKFEYPVDKNCPVCQKKKYELLEGKSETILWAMCGEDAVQVLPPLGRKVSFKDLEANLSKLGQVSLVEDFVLHFEVEDFLISIFSDGRAIIKGTLDKNVAKSLYSKYVGI